MIRSNDIEFMKKSINDVLMYFSSKISIKNLKPNEDQPNWNPVLNEVVGSTEYDIISNVPVDILQSSFVDNKPDNAGDRIEAKCEISIPIDDYSSSNDKAYLYLPSFLYVQLGMEDQTPIIIDNDTIITIENDDRMWCVKSSFNRTGEAVIIAEVKVGE